MRDRLIELLDECRGIEGSGMELVKKMADHLLANGVISPNVKIGDKVYVINPSRTYVNEHVVTHLEVYESGVKIFARRYGLHNEYALCWDSELGDDEEEWVFLTKEQAEKALVERGEGE